MTSEELNTKLEELEDKNVYLLSDEHDPTKYGSFHNFMKNKCRPVWVVFGIIDNETTENALDQLTVISNVRGFNDISNTTGDVIFSYANIQNSARPEISAPSQSKVMSVARTPTHILYIAGMEYKRLYGVVSSAKIHDEANNLASIMDKFRTNSGVSDCPPIIDELIWNGESYSVNNGSFEIINNELIWNGESYSVNDGSFEIIT
jgi:hypothetical protein